MVQSNLRPINQGQELMMNNSNDMAGQPRRRLPAQYNNAKMRLKQPSSTTAGGVNSASFEVSQQQITSSRTAQRQEGSSKTAQYVKQSGPLSDLIMTSQTNLAPTQTQHRIVMKGRNKSQVNVVEVQGPNSIHREQEQSNSQMPVQSSLDDDGGMPYESKVATAMHMQNLQHLEALASTDQGYQNIQISKLDHDRNPSGSSAGEAGEQYIGAGREELDHSMLGLTTGQPMTNYQIVEAQLLKQNQQQATSTKKSKGQTGVSPKVIHNRPTKQKNQPQQAQIQDQRLTQSQAHATFGKRQHSQAPPVISNIMNAQDQQVEARNMAVVQGLESVQYSQVVQAPITNQPVLSSAQIRKQQFERKTTLGPRGLPSTFNVQAQPPQEMNQSQREIATKGNVQSANNTVQAQTPVSKSVPPAPKHAPPQPAGEEPSLTGFGVIHKQLGASCLKYYKKKVTQMTGRKYRDGFSTRLLVAKETFQPKRTKLPVLILNLDGALGYWDEAKTYIFKERNLGHLMTLSHNFRIVAYSAEPKHLIKRLGTLMADYNRPFCFDAIYQITKKVHQPRVNISHILLDFQDEDEENMDLYASSSVVMVTADKQVLDQRFETMDLREILDFDKDYMTGNKAPLIIRVPHARLRANNSFAFDGVFQILVALLVSSRLKNFETPSFFSYNDRTRHLSLPTKEPCMCANLLPDKLKFIDKSILASKSLRFVMGECPYGFHLHKGFKRLTEAFGLNGPKPEWLEFHMRNFKALLPVKQRLQKLTQLTLQQAVPPTGKRLIVRCLTEEANRRYQNFSKKNENVRKHIRRYRGRYWAVNQIEDPNLEEEQADVVGELTESRKPMEKQKLEKKEEAGSQAESGEKSIAAEKPQKALTTEDSPVQACEEGDKNLQEGQDKAGAGSESEGDDGVPTSPSKLKEKENLNLSEAEEGGEFSSGDGDIEVSSESEAEQYVEDAQPIKYKVIDIKLQDTEQNFFKKMTMAKGAYDPHKPLKFECRKTKCKAQALIDICSKKQNTMMFMTNQAQHLCGAQALQVENQIAELVQRLNDAEKAGKREVVNYDF